MCVKVFRNHGCLTCGCLTSAIIFRMSCWHSIHGSSTSVPHADVWLRNISSMAFWWGSTLGHAALRVRIPDPWLITSHSLWTARWRSSQLLSWFVPTKVSSSAKTHSPSQEQLGFFETWIDQTIQNSSQFYHHCSVSINWGLIIPSHPCLILLDACYIYISIALSHKFHSPCTGLVLCTPFCWLNCPSCFKHTDIVGYSSLQYPLVTFHFNLSYTHLKYYALIMPCFFAIGDIPWLYISIVVGWTPPFGPAHILFEIVKYSR